MPENPYQPPQEMGRASRPNRHWGMGSLVGGLFGGFFG